MRSIVEQDTEVRTRGCATEVGGALELLNGCASCLDLVGCIAGAVGVLVIAVCWKFAPVAAAVALLASDQVV